MRHQFSDKGSKIALLGENDPPVCNILHGTSPIILSGPHNGWHVPQALYQGDDPLGAPAWWFDPEHEDHRHEACDWGMVQLFAMLKERLPQATTIESNYSRLVCDKNRLRDHCITQFSSEHGESWPVPGNQGLTEDGVGKRHEIYDAYIHELDGLIERVQAEHGGVVFLDLHSFSPTWQGEPRESQVGTIAIEDNPLFAHMSDVFGTRLGDRFIENSPYDLHSERNALLMLSNLGHYLTEKHGIWYNVAEFRNDVLSDPNGLQEIGDAVVDLVNTIETHPNKALFLGRETGAFRETGLDMDIEDEPPFMELA